MSTTEELASARKIRLNLANQLESLLARPLECEADIEPWRDNASQVEAYIGEHWSRLEVEAPHHLYHYFSDADIRVKEPEYRQDQEDAVREFIAELRA
jgi:hypothetical protein